MCGIFRGLRTTSGHYHPHTGQGYFADPDTVTLAADGYFHYQTRVCGIFLDRFPGQTRLHQSGRGRVGCCSDSGMLGWCKSGILLYESNPQTGMLLPVSNIHAFHISSVPRSNMYQRLFEERDNGLTGLERDRY